MTIPPAPLPLGPALPALRETRGLSVAARILVGASAIGMPIMVAVLPNGQLALPLGLAAIVVYLVWLTAARHNAQILAPETVTTTAGTSVVEYFLPVINLWAPVRTMTQIARASAAPPTARKLILAWGIAWDARLACWAANSDIHAPALHSAIAWTQDGAYVIAGVLCILVITSVERAQHTTMPPTA